MQVFIITEVLVPQLEDFESSTVVMFQFILMSLIQPSISAILCSCQLFLLLIPTFTQKVETFNENVSNYIEYVDQLAQKTEQEKARAMGFRNIISSEMERRNRRKLELEEEIVD
ncbi:MAG: hypothetical protein EZS28_020521, partial [Streblomastix strix]